jgi:molecular chaperone DnaK (HSP70)
MMRAGGALAAAALALSCTARRPASLGESLSVEQPGGTVSQLVAQGTELPTSATESFTTARDGDTRILVHVVSGTGKLAGKLKTASFWEIDGVAPAKAGDAKVMLTFELDAQGRLSVSAREDERRLEVTKRSAAPEGASLLAPLTEPDDADDANDDAE